MKNLKVLSEFGLQTLETEYQVYTKCRDFRLAFNRAVDWFDFEDSKHKDFFQRFIETACKVADFEDFWANRWNDLKTLSRR